jgi:membrane protein required for colicin V production
LNDALSQLNALDYVLLIILVGSLTASLVRGFTREIVGLVALVAAIALGTWFHGTAATFVAPYVSSPDLARLVGFGIVFFGVLIAGSALGHVLAKVWSATGLGLVDRLVGGMFGLVKGGLLSAAIVFMLVAFSPSGPPEFVKESQVAPYVTWGANALASLAPRELRDVVESNIAILRGLWENAPMPLPDLESLPGAGVETKPKDGMVLPEASPTPRPERRPVTGKPSPSTA